MNWFTGTMVYILLWWLTWFCALPIGVSPPENPEQGHEPGAPVQPYLWWKVGGTTIVAGVLMAIIYWLVKSDHLSFRAMVS
jgi:predicted secreted protein